jgi:capsular polysaccharide biosynthesis protein
MKALNRHLRPFSTPLFLFSLLVMVVVGMFGSATCVSMAQAPEPKKVEIRHGNVELRYIWEPEYRNPANGYDIHTFTDTKSGESFMVVESAKTNEFHVIKLK